MFGFLKKKLKEVTDKLTDSVSSKEEVNAEHIDDVSYELQKEEQDKKEIEYKKKLVEEAGMEMTPAIEEAIEAPYKKKEEPKEESVPEEIKEEAPKIEEKDEKPVEEQVKEITKEKPVEIVESETIQEQLEEIREEQKEKKPGFLDKLLGKKEKAPAEEPKEDQPKEEPKIEEKIEKPKIGLIEKLKKKVTEREIKEEDVKDLLWDMQISMLQSDVALEVAEKIVEDLRKALVGKSVKRGEVEKIVKDTLEKSLREIMNIDKIDIAEQIKEKDEKPYVIIFVGFNGVGKTMSIAKLGNMLRANGLSVVFAAADTWRAAALEQLEVHGKNLGINVIKQDYGSDPAAVIFDAVKHARSKGIDVVLADTAGRSHSNVNLSEELKKICRVNNPDMKILVVDVLTGNDAVDQAKMFNDAVGVDALILTKADVYDKGGALLSATHTIQKPIIFLGIGQDYSDMEPYDPETIIKRLLE